MKIGLSTTKEIFSYAREIISGKTTNLLRDVCKEGVKPLEQDCVSAAENTTKPNPVRKAAAKVKTAKVKIDKCVSKHKRAIKLREKFKATKEEIKELLELVEDDVVKKYVKNELNSIPENTYPIVFEKLEGLRMIVDAVNSCNGKYSVLKNGNSESYLYEMGKFIKENKMEHLYKVDNLQKDMEMEEKFFALKEYLKKDSNSPISEYLYDQYYLKFLEKQAEKREIQTTLLNRTFENDVPLENNIPEIISKLREINSRFGVKVFLDNTALKLCNEDAPKALDNLITEFSKWEKAGGKSTVYPPVFDTLSAKADYYDKTSAYGDGVSAGFSEFNGAISVDTIRYLLDENNKTIRHEMIHTNDNKRKSFIYGFIMVYPEILFKLCRFKNRVTKILEVDKTNDVLAEYIKSALKNAPVVKAEESVFITTKGKKVTKNIKKQKTKEDSFLYKVMLKKMADAGISERHIPYGFNNFDEMIAVLGEGNTNKYPLWMKMMARMMGMPKRVFHLEDAV